MKKEWGSGYVCGEYKYKGVYIYKLTRNDWCVYNADGEIKIHERTLKAVKVAIDELCEILGIDR